jgi:hypothetical protein
MNIMIMIIKVMKIMLVGESFLFIKFFSAVNIAVKERMKVINTTVN